MIRRVAAMVAAAWFVCGPAARALAVDEATPDSLPDAVAPDASGPEYSGTKSEAAPDGGEAPSEMELTGPGDEEEEAAPEEAPKPAPAPAPKPKPKPKPAPRPKPVPKPKPIPKPAPPASPYLYQMIEDFEKLQTGETTGAVKRSGGDPRPQFSAKASAPGCETAKDLKLEAVPALADETVWSYAPPQPLNLKDWRGLSLRVKAAQPVASVRIGVQSAAAVTPGAAGQPGGYVYRTAPIGTAWSEVRLDFSEDPGRGRFDPAAIKEILVTAVHEGAQPVDVEIDELAAWKDKGPSGPGRFGLNLPPGAGPFDWRADTETVNCVGRDVPGEGFVLNFWSSTLPYQHWVAAAAFHDLPRGLVGAQAVVATVKVDPVQPPVLLRLVVQEEGGERFAAVREATAESSTIRIPLDAAQPGGFQPDALWNLGVPPAMADGRLDPGAVREWRLEILPATERQVKGTLTLSDVHAESAPVAKPRPAAVPVASKPVVKPPSPRPPAKPVVTPAPPEPEPPAGEPPSDDAAPEAPEAPADDGGGLELGQ